MGSRGRSAGRPALRRARAAASALVALALVAGLAACTNDPLADQYRSGDGKGFIAADGFEVVPIPEAERTDPVDFEGVLDTGDTATSDDYRGEVLVVNFWYAACAPCRVEAPVLEEVNQAFDGDDVQFLGVNLYDGAEATQAFADTYGVTYPSALASVDGSIKLAFAGQTPLNAVPVTLVLDREGRVAARVIGQLSETSILETLVRETLEGVVNPGALVADGSLLVAIPIAVLAGLISFLSPCVLPLVPGYLGFIGGAVAVRDVPRGASNGGEIAASGAATGAESAKSPRASTATVPDAKPTRGRLLLGVLLFIAGFTVVFVSVAMLGGTLGRFLLEYADLITRILGVVIIAMGLVFIGVFGLAQRIARPQVRGNLGLIGAPLLGIALGIGWAPCIGPTLAVILTMAFDGGSAGRAALLGVAYSLGLGIPFVLLTLGFGWATRSVAFVRRHIRAVNIAGGVLLIVLGLLMVTGVWTRIMAQLQGCSRVSRSLSDAPPGSADDESRPLRPSDHADSTDDVTQPVLGFTGWLRWGWRQLTSMRTALVLLLLLAIAAIPGSLVPQRSADPNGVTQYFADNPDLAPILDNLSLFDVYTSPWFSAIYILLFVSLIGCVIPRTRHHWKALRAKPPRTPARLSRLDAYRAEVVELTPGADAAAAASSAAELAEQQLKKAGYRVQRYDSGSTLSVSAERGYLRETGNLVFHAALVGVLVSVGLGGGFTYTGQTVIIEGRSFVNSMLDYTSFNPGRFVDENALAPYSLTLDRFDVTYQPYGEQGSGQAGDFVANLTTQRPGEDPQSGEVRVNHPLDMDGDRIYLMGNGYAPTITIRDADGEVVYSESVPFLPQDTNMTSLGVVKVPDGLSDSGGAPEQMGLVGFFYPTQAPLTTGAFTSAYPDLVLPVLSLDVYVGDLGIDDGTPRSVYTLDPSGMDKLAGRGTDVAAIELAPGETADLPDGYGSITFENEASDSAGGYEGSVKRYVSLSIHRDAAAVWVLLFAVLATAGLLAALFVPRRRMWVKVAPQGAGLRIEYAGLARGEDPALEAAVEQFAERHRERLGTSVDNSPFPEKWWVA